MEWVEIDKNNIQNGEVLAANFKKGTYGYKEKLLGYLHYDEVEGFVTCESGSEVLENCTHYIDINKHDVE
jgi:hypothetical protein